MAEINTLQVLPEMHIHQLHVFVQRFAKFHVVTLLSFLAAPKIAKC